MNRLRQVGLVGTELARATCGTIRNKLLKVGALVRVGVQQVSVSFSVASPWGAMAPSRGATKTGPWVRGERVDGSQENEDSGEAL